MGLKWHNKLLVVLQQVNTIIVFSHLAMLLKFVTFRVSIHSSQYILGTTPEVEYFQLHDSLSLRRFSHLPGYW